MEEWNEGISSLTKVNLYILTVVCCFLGITHHLSLRKNHTVFHFITIRC